MTTSKTTPSEQTGIRHTETRAEYLALDFLDYCKRNPQERFWQALRNWSEHDYVFVSNVKGLTEKYEDTFYFEGLKE